MPYGANTEFVEMCQTSVASSYSVYSSPWKSQGPPIDVPAVTSAAPQPSCEDPRDYFIRATITRLTKANELLEAVAVEKQDIQQLLEIANLLIELGHVAKDKT
jgi:hypothetical protein